MKHRFFLPADCFIGGVVYFPMEITHQIKHVLRLEPGQVITVLDNLGSEYEVKLKQIDAPSANGDIISQRLAVSEPGVYLALYLGLTQREKYEWMLQKCTEVGACSFTPVVTRRSLVQDLGGVKKKYDRWERILCEAAEQSGRGLIPELHPPVNFNEAVLEASRTSALILLPWEEEHLTNLIQAFRGIDLSNIKKPRIACFIGPEGGFDAEEVDFACKSGAVLVTLGPRILRMETAAVVATALILHEMGKQNVKLA
jgi:16S rRNA (uracil1498-N3)-methyltransferase